MNRKILKSTATVGGSIFVSRIFGYIRDAVIFVFFGASSATDAFFVAFRIPNFLRRLFAEGAFSQAFVPVLSGELEKGENDFRRLIDHTTGVLGLILIAITTAGILTAPWLITLFAPGFLKQPDQLVLAADLLAITFPYLLFISLTALAGSILNTRQQFSIPAITPVFLNLSLIAATLWLAPRMERPIFALAWGVFIAGIVQLLFQLPFLARHQALPIPRLKGASAGIRRIKTLMIPALFGSSIVQINLLVDTIIASFLVTGSISWLYLSDRFVELPLALFGIATATVILPLLSRQHAQAANSDFEATLHWALRISLTISIPATLGLLVLAGPILATLLQYREFGAFDVHMASLSLIALTVGLPAFIFYKVLTPGFYARQDTKTPVKIGVIAMLINIVLNLSFVQLWRWNDWQGAHAGLALATSLSAYVNAYLLYRILCNTRILGRIHGFTRLSWRVFLASAVMLAVLWFITPATSQWVHWDTSMRVLRLLALIGMGALIYCGMLWLSGVRKRHFKRDNYLT